MEDQWWVSTRGLDGELFTALQLLYRRGQMTPHLRDFEQLLLFALLRLRDGTAGGELVDAIESRTGRQVSAGAVYTAMERMERKGLVSSKLGRPTPKRGGKPKRLYRLTPAGADALRRSYEAVRQMAEGITARFDAKHILLDSSDR